MTDTRLHWAKRLRREATALRKTADRLDAHATAAESEYYEHSTPLSGEQIVDRLCELVAVGSEAHYRTFYELLTGDNAIPRGEKPLATFLSAVNRSARFEAQGARTGIYRRVS